MEELQVTIPENLETMQLPDPGYVNFWRLAEDRIYYIDGEIDENALELQKAILYHNMTDRGIPADQRKPIKILINSGGGFLTEAMSLATTFKMSTTPVWTYNVGVAYSGACILLVAGQKRLVMPNSFALFHSGAVTGTVNATFEQTQESQKQYKKEVDNMCKFFQANTTIEEKLFKRNKSKDWYFTSDEQIKYGLADSIIESLDDILN